eukprot:EC789779.1.p1 GENE.EC789779.1~~EC789779.1.p1  ORF type:complete len:167 (+),score=52.40 EC789779.1:30-530(+)
MSSFKSELCTFSGFRIWPGHGIRYVPCVNMQSTKLVYPFINHKSKSLFHQRVNPRKGHWAMFYRRMHKKGSVEESKKRRSKRVTKARREITGLTKEDLKKKRSVTERKSIRAATEKRQKDEREKRKKGKVARPTAAAQSGPSRSQTKARHRVAGARARSSAGNVGR